MNKDSNSKNCSKGEIMRSGYVTKTGKTIKSKYIVVSLPWCHYFSDEWFENWKHRRPDEHLWFFDEKNIFNFAKSIGFKIINYCCVEDAIRGKNAVNLKNEDTAINRYRVPVTSKCK